MTKTAFAATRDSTEALTPMMKAISSARYMVNAEGHKTDIILPLSVWKKLLAWLENQEDRALVQEMLPRLKMGPEKAGALAWDEIADEWDDQAIL